MEGPYINRLLSVGASPDLLSELRICLHLAQNKVSSQLLQGKAKCPMQTSDFSSLIPNLQQRWTDDYQERQFLQMKKEKEALEAKLQSLNSTLQLLQPTSHSEEPQRRRRRFSSRRESSAEQVKKTMESQEFVRTMRERKRTEYSRIYKQIQQEIQFRSAVSESQELVRSEEAARKLREFHTQERLKLRETTLRHKAERDALKTASTSLPKIWNKQQVVPVSVSPTPPSRSTPKEKFSISDLRTHERKYATFLRSEKAKRHQTMADRVHDMQIQSALLPKSPATIISEETTPTRSEVMNLLFDKRRRYGNIVRELFRPSVDTQKREEMERKIEEMRKPKGKKRGKGRVSAESEGRTMPLDSAELDTQVSVPVPKRGKTVKPKSIKAKKEEVKYRNYLETLKRERTESALSRLRETPDFSNRFGQLEFQSSDKSAAVLAEADRLVQNVQRCEAALKVLPVTHPKALATEYSLNEVLMTAVKAKLALLQSTISN